MGKRPEQTMLEVEAANINKTGEATPTPQTGPVTTNSSLPDNYGTDATGRIFRIGDGSPVTAVVTSEDVAGEFANNQKKIDERIASITGIGAESTTQNTVTSSGEPQFDKETGKVRTAGDAVSQGLTEWEQAQNAQFEENAAAQKKQYESLFNTTLASIDETAAATIQGIIQTYDKRIDEQRRINQIRIDRTKAYGLGSDAARFTPLEYTDAVTVREQEAADEIAKLEAERNSLIAQAKAAASEGRSDLLRQNIEDINAIEDRLRSNLATVRQQADEQYRLLREYRKEQEQKHQEDVEKMRQRFAMLASSYMDEYYDKTDEEKTALINRIVRETGLDFATVYAELEKASAAKSSAELEAEKSGLEKQKLKAEAEKTARGELREVGGSLYQVTYDENGQATAKLIQSKPASGGGGGGSPKNKTAQELENEDTQFMVSFIEGVDENGNKILGDDQFMSPENYELAKKTWVEWGYDRKSFDKKFRGYTNPKNPYYRFD